MKELGAKARDADDQGGIEVRVTTSRANASPTEGKEPLRVFLQVNDRQVPLAMELVPEILRRYPGKICFHAKEPEDGLVEIEGRINDRRAKGPLMISGPGKEGRREG